MARRPRVTLNCVADRYHGPNERIVEFMGAQGKNGGLISLHEADDGSLLVNVYRCDAGVRVEVAKEIPSSGTNAAAPQKGA